MLRHIRRIPIGREQAVFTALFLIFLALFLARALPSLVPQEKPALELLAGGFFLLFSYPIVNVLVGGAIDKTATDAVTLYKRENSPQDIVERQNKDFQSFVLSFRNPNFVLSQIQDRDTHTLTRKFFARREILRTLSEDDWETIALEACIRTLGKENDLDIQIEKDDELTILWQDINIYLKAWLVLSIDYNRKLPIDYIEQRYPSKQSPDSWTYIRILRYIRHKFSYSDDLLKLIRDEYRSQAIEVLEDHLDFLIEELRRVR